MMESGNITEPGKESGSQIENDINRRKNPEMLEMMLRLKENPEMLEMMLKVKENPEMLEMLLKVKDNPEMLEMMVKVKEEPMSDDENEEVDAIGHTNYLEDSTEELVETDSENCMKLSNTIKTEDIRLNEEQGKETDHFIQKIKLETSDCSEEEKHTNITADSIDDNLKVEELVVAWTEDHYESSRSSEQPDFRDEMCLVPEFKHFLEESEIKYDVQNSLKRKIGETLEDSCSYEERAFDLASDEDDVIDLVVDEASKPKLKRIEPLKKRIASVAAAAQEVFVPSGWRRDEVVRKNGLSAGIRDIYYYSPDGKKLRSIKEVKKYCLEHGLDQDLSLFNSHRRSFSRGTAIASKSSKTCNTSKTTKPSKTLKLYKSPKPSKTHKENEAGSNITTQIDNMAADIIKNKEENNGKIAENFEDMADSPNLPVTTKYKQFKWSHWSDDVKLFAVKRYLETRSYKETIADLISKFNIASKPPSKLLISKWCGVVSDPQEETHSKNVNYENEEVWRKEKTLWSNKMKTYAVERYLETKSYEETIANFTEKFNPPKPLYKLLIMNWVAKFKRVGTIQDLRDSTLNLETYHGRKKKIQNEEFFAKGNIIIKDTGDWNLAKSSLRNIRIDKQHQYYSRKKIRIMHQPPIVPNDTMKWSDDMKEYAVERYLKTKCYKKTFADFTSKFNTPKPLYMSLLDYWVAKFQEEGNVKYIRSREEFIDKVPPKSEKLLTIMKNVFNDKDDDDDDNGDDNLHQDSNNGEAIDKYLKMWKVIYPLVDVQEQKDMHQETRGNIRQTMDKLRKLNEERNKKRLEAIVIKNTIKKTKPLKDYKQDCEKRENSDSSSLQEVDLIMNSSASSRKVVNTILEAPVRIGTLEKEDQSSEGIRNTDGSIHTEVDPLWHDSSMSSVLKADQNIEKCENEDIKCMWRGVLDSVKIEKFIQTASVIFPELTKEEIRKIYEEFKGNGQAIRKMRHLNKERKSIDDFLNKEKLEESKEDIEQINSDYNDNSDETNDGPLQNGKINKYIKMWKILYPAVDVQDLRKVYLENKGDVKKTMVELKKLNERTETDKIKDQYTVWSLADDETFSAGVCCPFCGRFFNYKASFLKHYNTHREEKPFACQYCQYRSKTEDNVKIHIQRTHQEDPLYVYQCKKEERPFGCSYCTYRFKSEDDRDKHIHKAHQKRSFFYKDVEERPFACSYCLYRSKQKGNLKTHVLAKHPDKPWPVPKMEEILKRHGKL